MIEDIPVFNSCGDVLLETFQQTRDFSESQSDLEKRLFT